MTIGISDKPKEIHYAPIKKDIRQIKHIIITVYGEKGNLPEHERVNIIVIIKRARGFVNFESFEGFLNKMNIL